MIKKIRVLIMMMVCIFVLPGIYMDLQASESNTVQRVFDNAGIIAESEITEIEQAIVRLREKIGMDVVIVTSDDVPEGESEGYAADFFDYGDFGTGNSRSGILLLIDMSNRMMQISTSGEAMTVFPDNKQEKIFDNISKYASNGAYDELVKAYLNEIEQLYNETAAAGGSGISPVTAAVASLTVSAAAAGIVCLSVYLSYKKKRSRQAQVSDKGYRRKANFAYSVRTEHLLDTQVTQRRIPRNPPPSSGGRQGGGTRVSSSGRSHGGGGRKF